VEDTMTAISGTRAEATLDPRPLNRSEYGHLIGGQCVGGDGVQ
jgi:hypothetical protein